METPHSFPHSPTVGGKSFSVDLLALRPIRRRDGTKCARMADGTVLELRNPRIEMCLLERPRATLHPRYLWRLAFVFALLRDGYRVIAAENHVLTVTRDPADAEPLPDNRLLAEAINARVAIDQAKELGIRL
jgi:hypothetical protein